MAWPRPPLLLHPRCRSTPAAAPPPLPLHRRKGQYRYYSEEDPPNHLLQQAVLVYLNAQLKVHTQMVAGSVGLVKSKRRQKDEGDGGGGGGDGTGSSDTSSSSSYDYSDHQVGGATCRLPAVVPTEWCGSVSARPERAAVVKPPSACCPMQAVSPAPGCAAVWAGVPVPVSAAARGRTPSNSALCAAGGSVRG